MDNFSNIGKAILVRAIGLQTNHTVIEKVDSKDNCIDCPYRTLFENINVACTACETCEQKVGNTYIKKYINEKNRFGYANKLGTNAIKLLLSYHTLHPDKNGIILNINIREQAKLLNVNIKTIKSCNNTLQDYGYISYSKTSTYLINVLLPEYKDYYKPASEGGRGFFVMSKELFYELLKIDSLVMLRIALRQLIEIDNLSIKGVFNVIEKTYHELRRGLPKYCKPNVIRSITETTECNIFDIQIKDNSLRFFIKDDYNSKKHKSEQEQLYFDMFSDFIKDFNTEIVSLNTSNYSIEDFSYKDFVADSTFDMYSMLAFSKDDIKDMSILAMQYSFEKVIEALSSIYKEYKLKLKHIRNIGGLLRTIIIASYKEIPAAA